MNDIRWGIIGPGGIAKQFARGLSALDDHRLVAVASRDGERAAAFAAEHGAERSHAGYQALIDDPAIDAVYVATPHPFHHDPTIAALQAGKAVLCEKPLAINAGQVEAMIAASAASGSFLMEAMWTRFLPAVRQAMTWLAEGAIGEARQLRADFGFRCNGDPKGRLLNPDLAGGGLLDVGVYCLALAEACFGPDAAAWSCQAHIGPTGVDEQAAMIGRWADGRLAALTCGVCLRTPHDARIDGSAGHIVIPDFWHATRAELHRDGEAPEIVEHPFLASGYEFEAAEVGRCLRAGLRESPDVSHASSLAIARILDDCRRQIGLRYPGEA